MSVNRVLELKLKQFLCDGSLSSGSWLQRRMPPAFRPCKGCAMNSTSLPQQPAISACLASHRSAAIFVVSAASLFLEVMLIRWVTTEFRIFAYLQNTVLVVCLLGLGMGFFASRRPFSVRKALVPLLILVVILIAGKTRNAFMRAIDQLSLLGDLVIWFESVSHSPAQTVVGLTMAMILTLGLMLLIWLTFVPFGQLLGELMNDHPRPIWAYSLNVAASLIGIWAFVLLSALSLPPGVWMALAGSLLVFLVPWTRRSWFDFVALGIIVAAGWFAGNGADILEVHWSPYQKLVLSESPREGSPPDLVGQYMVRVNNVGYQAMIDLGEETVRARPDRYASEMAGLSQYDIPYLLHPKARTSLIVGAGTGNDAAGALRHAIEQVTAVEIDPTIIALGRKYHPEQPYASSRVRVITDDARSFFASSADQFDVISFGLLDSHTTTAMTNTRLDHYVYTRESLERARSLLKDGGVMVLSFEARRPYIADRIGRVLRDVFGEEPMCFVIPVTEYGWGGVMFVTGNLRGVRESLAANARLSALISRFERENPVGLTYTTRVATDDWPYLYLERPWVPTLYWLLAGMLVLLYFLGRRHLRVPGELRRWGRVPWHFFFLGAAFMLLEVQNISKASVVLGNTWLVNSVIVSGVLIMVLLANALAAAFPRLLLGGVYAALCGSCLILYFVDLASFAFLPFAAKAVSIGTLTTVPMMFSGIIFVRSFAAVPNKDTALGANMMGALVGGVLQSMTFVTGIKALLLIVAALYGLALVTRPRLDPNTASVPSSDAANAETAEAAEACPATL
jgi:spermidine synthase